MESVQDQAFMAEATRRGLVSADAIQQALTYGQGREPLPETLMRVGLLRPAACKGLLTDLEQQGFVCMGCKTPLRYAQLADLSSFACPRCGEKLRPRDPPSGLAQSLASGNFPAVEKARTLGSYTLLEELGRGCMGVVYKARKAGLQRHFALKIMLNARDDEDIERFKQEAQVASKLEHRGIIGVFDVGQAAGHHYYVMDYCAGDTLKDKIARGRLDPQEAARLMEQLARTMHYAHSHSVVHRDLKPANIILEAGSGTPRVTDFGLAKDYGRVRSLTQSGDILGTPFYMSPEQFRGKGIDARADVWAMGVILYECLTGQRPFEGKDHRELGHKVRRPPKRPTAIVRDLPPDIEAICLCAMAPDKNDRYMNAEALAEDLEAFLRGETPSHASGVLASGPGSHPWIKAAALTLLASGLAAAGVIGVITIREASAERKSQEARAAKLAEEARRTAARDEQRSAARTAIDAALDHEKSGGSIDDVLKALLEAESKAPAGSETAWQAAIARAGVLVRRGRPQQALECATAARLQPDAIGWEALRIVAEAQEKLGLREEARQTYSQLQAVNPGGVRGLTAAAARKRLEAAPLDARALAERALRRDPDYPPAIFELLFASLPGAGSKEVPTEGRGLLARAKRIAPPTPRLVTCEAIVAASIAPQEALRVVNHAIALCSEHPEALLLRTRGGLLGLTGDLDPALADLDAAIALDPRSSHSYFQRARFRWAKSKQDWEEPRWLVLTKADLEECQARAPEQLKRLLQTSHPAFARQARALLLGETGDPFDFALTLELHRRLEKRARRARRPGRKALRRALLRAASGGSWEEVAPLYAAAVKAAPGCPTIAFERAKVAVGREDFDLARAEIKRARRLGASDLDLDFLLALLYWLDGKAYEAAPRFESLVTRDRHGIVGLCARAWWLLAHERDAIGLVAARRAVDFDPEHVPSLIINASLLLRQGQENADAADALVKRALTIEGAIDCRLVREAVDVRTKQLFLKANQTQLISPKVIDRHIELYERLMPLCAGTGILLDAVQFLILLPPGHSWHPKCEAWIAEAARRNPDLGMIYVLAGLQQMQAGKDKTKVIASWKKAREVESRILISDWRLEEYRRTYPGPCPELEQFEAKD